MVGDHSTTFGVVVTPLVSGKQAAPLADKILQGTPAGSIPVVSAENSFLMNYKAAQAIGIEVSEGLLNQADEIIR
jgi:putative ABC transport system substrate-binding protein